MGALHGLMQRLHGPIYAARLKELVRRIIPHLREGDRVLDVGCGFGALGRALLDDPACPPGVSARGLERFRRDELRIEVDEYDGRTIPWPAGAFDVVILADVLHHEADPHRLIDECSRVAKRLLIIKDHARAGVLAQPRLALIDWAANAPYGVRCLFRYNTVEQWRAWHERHGLRVVEEHTTMHLYPAGVNLLFGRRLQYMAVLSVEARAIEPAPAAASS